MNYILIVSVIIALIIIAVISYIYLSKDKGIKDGKYGIIGNKNNWYEISNNRVDMWGYGQSPPGVEVTGNNLIKVFSFDIVKSNMKANLEGKEIVAYKSTNPVDRVILYLVQSSYDDRIHFFVEEDGKLV